MSIGTVSRAINNRPGVNSATRERILKKAEEIGYFANASGRALRQGVTNAIGIVLEVSSRSNLRGDNFFFELLDGFQEVTTEADYDLLILPMRHSTDPIDSFSRTVNRGLVDAIVLTATRNIDPRIERLMSLQVPFLTLGRSATPGEYSWIDLDFEGMARTSIEALVQLGHNRIAVMAPRDDQFLAKLYVDAAAEALASAGVDRIADLIMLDDADELGGLKVAERLASAADRPTAVISCSEPMMTGLYAGLERSGLRVGTDMAVIGFRDGPQSQVLAPQASFFHIDVNELGREIGRASLTLANARKNNEAQPYKVIWPVDLHLTDSVFRLQ